MGTQNLNYAAQSEESQNISFEIAYIDYTYHRLVPGWLYDRLLMGNNLGNRETGPTAGQIKFFAPIGPVTLVAAYAKEEDHSYSAYVPVTDLITGSPSSYRTDRDYDSYRAGFIYNFKGDKAAGEAGALFIFNRDASNRGTALGAYMTKAYVIQPYFKAKIGPVALQGEN